MRAALARYRTAAWLGWQVESNWADPFVFAIYSLLRPLGAAFILAGMYWAVAGNAARPQAFAALFLGSAFHEYVLRLLVGMGWVVFEEREEYETLKYVVASPVGMFTYLWGRSAPKFALASVSVLLTLAAGWFVLGVRWDWGLVHWLALLAAFGLGLVAAVYLGFLVAGLCLLLPRAAMNVAEGAGLALYLLCGVIFPVDMLPRGLQAVALALPFTYWYECLRRFLLGRGASALLSGWSDGALLGALAATTLLTVLVSRWGYHALERRARQQGRIDQATLF
jgi:ABC-2 type transport system permease protein